MKPLPINLAALVLSALLAAGRALAHGNDFEMVVALTLEIAQNPKEPGLLLERAEVYRTHGDLETARRDLATALEIQPDFHPARVRLALLARDQGRLDESLQLLNAVVQAQPAQPLALSVRSEVLRRLKRHPEAVADLDAILAIPGIEPIPQLYLDKARSQLEAPSPNTNAILADLDKGIARMGPVTSLLLMALDLEEQSGRIDAALARLDSLAKDSPRKERWLERRGDILARAGRKPEAIKAFSDAMAAIDALPDRQRLTVATTELRAAIESKLGSLGPNPKPAQP